MNVSILATSVLATAEQSGGSGIMSLAILALIPLAMYFFMIRPQRQRMKAQAEMQDALGVGDEVITSSGIFGFITGEEDDKFWLEIDDDVQVRIAREAIRSKVVAPTADDDDDDSDVDNS